MPWRGYGVMVSYTGAGYVGGSELSRTTYLFLTFSGLLLRKSTMRSLRLRVCLVGDMGDITGDYFPLSVPGLSFPLPSRV